MSGRSIRIFLVDGTATGIMTAEIMNWTGKIIVSPRSQLVSLAQRNETKRTGIYVLVGEDPSSPIKDKVYIGESDNVLKRLTQHNSNPAKDFWSRTVIVISKDENLTKAHVRYLESRLIEITAQASQATLENGTSPETPSLPEPDVADMEYFLEQLLTLLPVLNFPFATSVPTISTSLSTQANETVPTVLQPISPIFTASSSDYNAKAQELDGQFVILKGSTIKKETKNSLGATYRDIREQLTKDGTLVETTDGVGFQLTADVSVSSPSGAASIITGTSVNGREFWKVEGTSQTYNQWDQERISKFATMTSDE
ncbi:GIY-YIG nuclease family protein [Nostoc sp. FACHB-280]|uniref:GIY-YIG nuclease family protein n=1 Tax=Nostoc sp. FACHB-280 TaxID=2692839 RepID=UPI00168A4C16|nr:GIY-YIG nuclease family protein [Nostoc sp. FACHB-280]MBD2498761.1 GIY-YIG nuclease family protein [Nostoc sp. FACHB-280]